MIVLCDRWTLKDQINPYFYIFYRVIDSDFEVWEKAGGITAEKFEAAKKLGTHYQIINHKLYRESDCMFPAR